MVKVYRLQKCILISIAILFDVKDIFCRFNAILAYILLI